MQTHLRGLNSKTQRVQRHNECTQHDYSTNTDVSVKLSPTSSLAQTFEMLHYILCNVSIGLVEVNKSAP